MERAAVVRVAARCAAGVLLVVWVVEGYRSGVRADEQGTVGDITDGIGRLGAALVLAVLSVLGPRATGRRRARRSRRRW